MQTKQINDIQIKPVIHLALEPTEILGYDYFPNLYSNIYIFSKIKSGKTTLIYNILKHCVSKRSNVVLLFNHPQRLNIQKDSRNVGKEESECRLL
jgi:hypothetical protein